MINPNELRQKYLSFFEERGHKIIPSASLVPENDPTVLFVTAGMQPLVPYLLGETHSQGKRLVDIQKCVRTNDIEEVGDTTHHTFFEMLGNWSLGDYFKKEAIEWSFEFLTFSKGLELNKDLIAVSVFAGDNNAPFDKEAFDVWISLGISEARIAKLPKENNWWGPAGQTGPCGPSSEMFYWVGNPDEVPDNFDSENILWVEIWNDVFMEFNKKEDGTFEPLGQKNIDTGMGMERTLAVINGFNDNFKSELFTNIIAKIEELSSKKYGQTKEITKAMRVIVDHLRAVTFIMGDEKGMVPSKTDQGYIIRRLIRRAIRFGKSLGIEEKLWTEEVAKVVIQDYKKVYPELENRRDFILKKLREEEKKFGETLTYAEPKVFDEIEKAKKFEREHGYLDLHAIGSGCSVAYQSYGYPEEFFLDRVQENFDLDWKQLKEIKDYSKKDLEKHQELSRQGASQKFSGGLADHSEQTTKLHTATHLLHQALRHVLGEHVKQAGSNITPERLRFDFTHGEKLTDEELKVVENQVNEVIQKKLPVKMEIVNLEEAKKRGALALFEDKYQDKVKLYKVGDYSVEVCGGPHVENTGELGVFKIKKQESVGRGVRRIKAVLS